MSAEILARIQFAFTTSFHFIFPPLSIGLGLFLVLMEGSYLRTGNRLYHDMTRFWVLIFGLIFGIGVATGIVLEFEFGTNWSRYAVAAGDVFGSPLAAEGVFAFFLESGFLGILVFGWDKVSKKTHFLATVLVWVGSMFSAVWIIVANSWMQTPAGHKLVNTPLGPKAELVDFWAAVFNPSTVDRLTHTVVGAFITAACLVASVSAYYLIKKRHEDFARESLKLAVVVGLVASLLQLFIGHVATIHVAHNQPIKYAAMEGYFDSSKPGDLTILGVLDEEKQEVKGIKVPGLADYFLGEEKKNVKGISEYKAAQKPLPPVQPVFQTFHLMVAIGMLLIAMFGVSVLLLPGGRLYKSDWLLKLLVPAVILPHLANNLGWMTAELGRQPWTIYGIQTTSQGVSPNVTAPMVLGSLVLFVLLYALLFVLFLYLLDRRIKRGPTFSHSPEEDEALLKPEAIPGGSR